MADADEIRNPVGRPALYTKELADLVCEELAIGRSLRSVCADDGMPAIRTVFKWLRENTDGFSQQYARAKEESADALVEEILDIADNGDDDYTTKTSADGTEYEAVNHENIQRSRLRVDARKWAASKMKPKKYGDKLDLTNAGGSFGNAATVLFGDDEDNADSGTEG